MLSLAFLLLAVTAGLVATAFARQRLRKRIQRLRKELVEVAGDASVGHRLSVGENADMADLAVTINRLFDALGERDQMIQGRDRLFRDSLEQLMRGLAPEGS